MFDTIIHFFQITSGLDVELFRITFITSILFALAITYKRENAPLGLIVPGTILLLLGFPIKLLIVLCITALVFITAKLLQKYVFPNTIFASREKLILAVFLSIVYSLLSYVFFNFSIEVFTAGAVGMVVPAMIADKLDKKHWKQSLKSFFITFAYTVAFFVLLKFTAMDLVSTEYKEYLNLLYPIEPEMSSTSVLVLYTLFAITAITNFILYRTKKLQSTGLLLGAYFGVLIFQLSQIAFVLCVIGITYLIMLSLYKYTMIFGFRIFVLAMLVVSVVYSLAEQIAYYVSNGAFHAFIGLHFAGLVVCGILVSEMIQHGHKKVISSSIVMTSVLAFSLIIIQLISTYTHNGFTISDLLQKSEGIQAPVITVEKQIKKHEKSVSDLPLENFIEPKSHEKLVV